MGVWARKIGWKEGARREEGRLAWVGSSSVTSEAGCTLDKRSVEPLGGYPALAQRRIPPCTPGGGLHQAVCLFGCWGGRAGPSLPSFHDQRHPYCPLAMRRGWSEAILWVQLEANIMDCCLALGGGGGPERSMAIVSSGEWYKVSV